MEPTATGLHSSFGSTTSLHGFTPSTGRPGAAACGSSCSGVSGADFAAAVAMQQPDGHEVVRRQAEWEREIETLDQKEMELHQSQLRLIREQTAIFIRDLAVLQQEVATLKAGQAQQASVPERVDYIEKVLGDSAEKHSRELQAAHGKLDILNGRLSEQQTSAQEREAVHISLQRRVEHLEQVLGESANKHAKDLYEAKSAQARLESNLTKTQEERHASVVDRLDYIEGLVGDNADRHIKELKATHTKVEQAVGRMGEQHGYLKDGHTSLQNRVEHLEQFLRETVDRHSRELDSAKASHSKLTNEAKVRETQGASMAQRVEFLEKMCGDAADKHGKELDLARNKIDQLHGRLGDHHSQLLHFSSLQDRVSYVEKLIADTAEKHTEELAAAHAKVDQMRTRVSTCEAHSTAIDNLKKSHATFASDKAKHDARNTSLSERVDYVEKVLGDLTERYHREGTDTKSRLDQYHGRIAMCEKHGPMLGDLQKAHAGLANEKAASDTHHATTRERVEYLEGLIGSNADKHFKELESLKTAHARLATESKQRDGNHATFAERLSYLEQQLGDSAEKHAQELAGAHARLEQLQGRLSTCEAHGVAIEGLKKSHVGLTSEKAARDAHHASLTERVEYLERLVGDGAEQHSREVAAAHTKIDQLTGRLAACERNTGAVADLQKAHSGLTADRAQQEAMHEEVKGRMEDLHRMLADHGDKHSRELEAVKAAHNRFHNDAKARDSQHSATNGRLEQLESSLAAAAEKHSRDLNSAHAKLDSLSGRMSDTSAAHEAHVRSLVANEKEMRDANHATLKERVDYLETLLGESADKHLKELEALKTAHAKHSKEAKARDTHHASINERLEKVERVLGDAHGRSGNESTAVAARLEQVHGRLTTCEKQCTALEESHKGHAGTANDKAAVMERNHFTLREKVEFLESRLGDSVEKHRGHEKEVEAVRVAHSKLSAEGKQRDAKHASMEERLKYLEKVLDDSVEKHASQLTSAANKLEDMHARLAHCEAQGTAIENLKKAHANMSSDQTSRSAHHASVAERLEYLERLLGDSADTHAKELAAAHAKMDQLHGRLAEERAAREAHRASLEGLVSKERDGKGQHATLQKRLDNLESLLNASASKYDQLDQKVTSITQLMDQNTANIQEYLLSERQAREGHEREVKNHLSREKSAREVHEGLMQDQLGHERSARDRHHELTQELLAREREERQKHAEGLHNEIKRHAAGHEASHKELHDLLFKEKAIREQSHSSYSDSVQRERVARNTMEDLLAQEKAERSRHHETVNERVDSLQRTVNIFDSLIRKEMDERSKENRRIWDAIDNHTHDLSTQVIQEGMGAGEQGMLAIGAGTGGSGGVDVVQTPAAQQRLLRPVSVPMVAPVTTTAYAWPGQTTVAPAPAGALALEPVTALPPTTALASPVQQTSIRPISPTAATAAASAARSTTPMRSASQTNFLSAIPTSAVGGCAGAGGGGCFGGPPLAWGGGAAAGPGPSSPRHGFPGMGEHSVERVTCGHTRYGGERQRAAEIHMD